MQKYSKCQKTYSIHTVYLFLKNESHPVVPPPPDFVVPRALVSSSSPGALLPAVPLLQEGVEGVVVLLRATVL